MTNFTETNFTRGKSIRVFLSGDYEFLCRCYGLSGASGKLLKLFSNYDHENYTDLPIGRHCCLWCDIKKDNLKCAPTDRDDDPTLRSLESLEKDHSDFMSVGKGDLRKAKEHNNVIGKAFFNIPLGQV